MKKRISVRPILKYTFRLITQTKGDILLDLIIHTILSFILVNHSKYLNYWLWWIIITNLLTLIWQWFAKIFTRLECFKNVLIWSMRSSLLKVLFSYNKVIVDKTTFINVFLTQMKGFISICKKTKKKTLQNISASVLPFLA